jgi:type VI secretion system protein ImpM
MPGGLVNHHNFRLPIEQAQPGWYGKLPGTGDFAQRRLPTRFVSSWDRWLQSGFEYLRGVRQDWESSYLEGHVWFFQLGPSVIGPKPWIGVLVPSVDAVGRYFPLTVALELIDAPETTSLTNQDDSAALFLEHCAQCALQALEEDLTVGTFDERLLEAIEKWTMQPLVQGAVAVPRAARSIWHTASNFRDGDGFSVGGLPAPSEFTLLFDSASEATATLRELAK